MSAFHQIGHDSENLLKEMALKTYRGAILSPVNYNEQKVKSQIQSAEKYNLEMIFDPQLYYPKTERRKLKEWSYFPDDVDTTDLTSEKWWLTLSEKVLSTCVKLNITSVCSPASIYKSFDLSYFSLMVDVGNKMAELDKNNDIIQTIIIKLADLTVKNRIFEIASVISRSKSSRVYLIFISDRKPRLELNEVEELKGAMKLINLLEKADIRLIIGYCSSDMILWKAAGANTCATGKFFNLRRFTSSRFDEPSGGGGQLPYWFDESLVAFLRESDVLRLMKNDMLNLSENPYGVQILNNIKLGRPWLGLSWRHYLYSFADLEIKLHNGEIDIIELLNNANEKWKILDRKNIFMEERANDGGWLRIWLRAIKQFM